MVSEVTQRVIMVEEQRYDVGGDTESDAGERTVATVSAVTQRVMMAEEQQ